MRKISKKLCGVVLAGAMALSLANGFGGVKSVNAAEIEVRENKENASTSDMILVGVKGKDVTSSLQEMLDIINEERRKVCCEEHIPDPNNKNRNLTESDYHELQIGYGCLNTAMIRSAEAAVFMEHTRPNGTSWSSVLYYFNSSASGVAENLAWSNEYSSNLDLWLGEKDAYLGKESGVTGHYKSLINPNYHYIGLASFNTSSDNTIYTVSGHEYKCDWTTTAGDFAVSDIPVTNLNGKMNKEVIQKMQVPLSSIKEVDIDGEAILGEDDTNKFELLADVYYEDIDYSGSKYNTIKDCIVYDGVTWTSSNENVISIDSDGNATVNSIGESTITASIGTGSNKKTVSKLVKVGLPEGATVKELDTITVESRKAPTLPKKVPLDIGNGKTIDIDVTWDLDSYSDADLDTLFKSNDFTVTGKAYDFDVTQKVHVKPTTIESVFTVPAKTTTNSGTKPTYPKAYIDLANTVQLYDLDVTWDEDWSTYYMSRKGGTFTLTGKTTRAFPTDEDEAIQPEVSSKLVVNPATVKTIKFDSYEVTTPSGTAPTLPYPTVTWSNGDVDTAQNPAPKEYGYMVWEDADKEDYKATYGGTYTITGHYHDAINNVNYDDVVVTVNVIPKVATEIHASKLPLQKIAKPFDCGGANLTIKYDNGEVVVKSLADLVTSGDVIITGFDKDVLGQQTITITFNEVNNNYDSDIAIKESVDVKDRIAETVVVVTEPDKTEYIEGQDLDPTGATIRVDYDNGTSETLDVTTKMLSGYDKTKIGNQVITVTKDDKSDTFTVNVRVKQVQTMYITQPEKLEYIEGEAFSFKGCSLYLFYDNDTNEVMTSNSLSSDGFTFKLYDSDKAEIVSPDSEALLKSLKSGKYSMKFFYKNMPLYTKDDLDAGTTVDSGSLVRFSVKKLERDAAAVLPEDTETDFGADATDEDIISEIEGTVISVPCADGEVISVTVTEDMVEAPKTLSEDTATDEEKEMIALAASENKEVKRIDICLAESAEGEKLYTSVYVFVAKKAQGKADEGGSGQGGSGDGQQGGTSEQGGSGTSQQGGTDNGSNQAAPGQSKAQETAPVKVLVEASAAPVVGETVTVGNAKVKLLSASTASYVGPTDKNVKSVTIPDKVKIDGKSYKVTMIEEGAFSGCTKLTSVIIPKNVTSIKAKAFYGCSSLKKITIKTTKLKKKSIGKLAFKSVNKKAKVKVPKSKKKLYKTLLKKAGLPKSAKVQK